MKTPLRLDLKKQIYMMHNDLGYNFSQIAKRLDGVNSRVMARWHYLTYLKWLEAEKGNHDGNA